MKSTEYSLRQGLVNRTQSSLPILAMAGLLAAGLFLQRSHAGDLEAGTKSGQEKTVVVSEPLKRPAWLTDLSLNVKEGYDSNVFLSGLNQVDAPKGMTTLKDIGSWVTTISPKIGFDFAPLLGAQKVFQALTLSYAPDIVDYHEAPTENNTAHRVNAAIKGKVDALSFSLENGFVYVDGNKEAPYYPGNYRNAMSTVIAKERTEQVQERTKIVFQYDLGKWFLRPVATLLYYDMQTNLKNLPAALGYQNYADRYDINGGMDIGYKIVPDVALTAGYRYGYQYQEQFAWSICSSPSNYQRLLFGTEGKPLKWLKVQFQLGPDFRHYEANSATHLSPVSDLDPVVFYGEANVTAELTSKDSLVFQFKEFRWVSCTGQIPYQDTLYDLGYTRKMTEKLSVSLGARGQELDYTCANLASGKRDDWMVSLTAGVRYAFTSHLSAELGYSVDWGLNGFDDLPPDQLPESKREFVRQIVSIGAQLKF